MRRLTGTLALLLFGLLTAACNMSIQEIVDARRGSSESENIMVAAPQAQFIYSHAVW
ncbi:MAG: hypothetical protein OXG07_01980 [Anaerolineaceae bacterium]|nr:hypothetical protein [Anaerolineaceae bacterium]MCY3906316.1 hypothetical protein [Anaerolineaceae bacterium]MDE0609386.1 hypothetical protein [Anaerolineaceae bacterium]